MAEGSGVILVWLRNDLRLADNPALATACASGGRVRALYVHETDPELRPIGGAARWWLSRSLNDVSARLAALGIPLDIVPGHARHVVADAARRHRASSVLWNRRYAPAARALDADIKTDLRAKGVGVDSFPGNVLVEPFGLTSASGKPYAVFTPFWQALRRQNIAAPLAVPKQRGAAHATHVHDGDYAQPRWARKLDQHWQVGEAAADKRLTSFIKSLTTYPEDRDRPGVDATSRLSPHLRFGEISARYIWHAVSHHAADHPEVAEAAAKFLSELAWRDFSYVQLYHRDDIATVPMQLKFAGVRWRTDDTGLTAWQLGETGIPIVDAGMRQLWATGWMHNRVRMLCASLLSKNLLIDWRDGERWFWNTLVDADEANNPASWQWVAGSGLDAAPYFRIFNPVTQGEKFDPAGDYVRRWVPELARLPDAFIHRPADASAEVLAAAGVAIGTTYPAPIVDLVESRRRALAALAEL